MSKKPGIETQPKWQDEKPGEWVILKTNQFIAFNKPATLPAQADKTGDKSLHQLAEIYCKSKLYPIHRLDRPASGVTIFAKNKTAAATLGEQFKRREVEKFYLAVVGNLPPEKDGLIANFIQVNPRTNRSEVCEAETPGSQPASLKYHLLGSIENYHLLEVQLLSGRHHQIRTQLAALGCPIKGDVKYGARRGNRDRSIHLHAWKMTFRHPVTGEQQTLIAPPPQDPVWDAFKATCLPDEPSGNVSE
jgi:23S rRNA pseudouridine1911/1915/1917 synthase